MQRGDLLGEALSGKADITFITSVSLRYGLELEARQLTGRDQRGMVWNRLGWFMFMLSY